MVHKVLTALHLDQVLVEASLIESLLVPFTVLRNGLRLPQTTSAKVRDEIANVKPKIDEHEKR